MSKATLRRAAPRIAAAAALAVLVAACAEGPPTPAPVVMKGGVPGVLVAAAPIVATPMRPPPLPSPPPREAAARQIVVQPGQSLGGLARDYHVPRRAIIAANHLRPPYQIDIGQRLVIPGAAEQAPERRLAATAATQRPAEAGHLPPEIIPLDGPAMRPHPAASPRPSPPEPSAAREARTDGERHAPRLPHGGHLPWPVHGHILADYGPRAGGGYNDGINIAAPRGAAVRAVAGGVVAYAGNELRGYGNLILIKHPDGFISAYAHCERLLVRRGQRVRQGQLIARVGTTGRVNSPQLHFELRRGERAVDPRRFLAPAPRAERGTRQAAG